MINKLYYWANNLENYTSDNDPEFNKTIEIKRLNFFIGKNNAGKSRFLRQLFQTKDNLRELQKYDLKDELDEIISYLKKHGFIKPRTINDKTWSTDGHSPVEPDEKNNIIKDLNSINNHKFKLLEIEKIIKKIQPTLLTYVIDIRTEQSQLKKLIDDLQTKILKIAKKNLFSDRKLYIPILRGMRPVSDLENSYPYIERAQKDYFLSPPLIESSTIITGEYLYNELKIHLLGEPEQRELIKEYEEKLSQYFFDNEHISLIPKHDQDVVNIKIGADKQFPISQLGDGLQQAIILTYEAYMKKKNEKNNEQICAFFIEEPELHMHAGMLRQLMNFYLNETNHFYFFTTHSNHLLDMIDESDQVIIQKFIKESLETSHSEYTFKIHRCGRDRDLLASLGVRPSSVYLANSTIWVEGITDRLYITKYMEKYLQELQKSYPDLYKKYRRFMPNYHYTFVEYAGSNLTHWSFSDDYVNFLDDKGLSAKAIASDMLLIADGDITNKIERVKALKKELPQKNYYILKCKETENTLPKSSIIRVAKSRFSRMKSPTIKSYDISRIDSITDENYFDDPNNGIGKLLDIQIRKPSSKTEKTAFADGLGVGTIKYKLDFCREIIKDFDDHPDWELTSKAKELCEKIFQHIEKCNL